MAEDRMTASDAQAGGLREAVRSVRATLPQAEPALERDPLSGSLCSYGGGDYGNHASDVRAEVEWEIARKLDAILACDTCGGGEWVCENHRDKPWGGTTDRVDACDCGAGAPCDCSPLALDVKTYREWAYAERSRAEKVEAELALLRAQNAKLVEALKRLAYLRPAGDIEKTRNAVPLLGTVERIALTALRDAGA